MPGDTDVVLSSQTHLKTDHILVDLNLENDLKGRLIGDVFFTRSTIGTFEDKNDGFIKTAEINQARFESKGILIENSIKNLSLHTKDFNDIAWVKTFIGTGTIPLVTSNFITGPDLSNEGTRLQCNLNGGNTSSDRSWLELSTVETSRLSVTSIFAKLNSEGSATFSINNTSSASVTITSTDWKRVGTIRPTTTPGRSIIRIGLIGSVGQSDSIDISIFGSQLEELNFLSSYINATIDPVIRQEDQLSIDSENISSSIGSYTISVEIDILGLDSTKIQTVYNVDGETLRNIEINTTTGKVEATHGDVTSISTTVLTPGIPVKIDFSVNETKQALYINGIKEAESTKGVVTGNRTKVSIGNSNGTNQLFGHIKNFKIYDIGLSDKQIINPDLAIEFESVDFDISFDSDGDILTDDFFDTSLLYSLLGEKRADQSEVVEPQLRRGWIGNEGKDFENGSKLWLFEQARVTRTNLNRIEDEARKSLQWLIDDGFLVSIDEVNATVKNGKVSLEIVIRRSRSEVERRFFVLWENTGLR